MPAGDHTDEIATLHRRYPRWSIWFGLATGHWWALPPADRDIGDFVEATTRQKLIASIEVIQQNALHKDSRDRDSRDRDSRDGGSPRKESRQTDSRQGIQRPSASLHLEGVTATPLRRVPAAAWPGSTSR